MGNVIRIIKKNSETKEKYIDVSKLISVDIIDDQLVKNGDFVTDYILDLTFVDNSKEKFIFLDLEDRVKLFEFILNAWNNGEIPLTIEL